MKTIKQHKKVFLKIALVVTIAILSNYTAYSQQLWNDSHIEHLRDTLNVNGEECSVIRIYANAPDYEWVVDDDEGAACVDDVARAARMYLERYRYDGDESNLMKAKDLIRFVLLMMSEDGQYYNFVWPDGKINKEHRTSIKSLDWWSARAFRTLALASSVLPKEDDLQNEISISLEKTFQTINNSPEFFEEEGYDRHSEWLLGFIELKKSSDSKVYDPTITQLADILYENKHQPDDTFPYTVHFSWRNHWHTWAALQVEALARAGSIMHRQEWIQSAIDEADSFHRWLLINGQINELVIDSDTLDINSYSQIAYGLNSLIQSQIALYEITNKDTYLVQAGLFSSWFNGNNEANIKMYDPESGRCFDGLSADKVNRNSGAESTIEALLAITLVDKYPRLLDMYNADIIEHTKNKALYHTSGYNYIFEKTDKRIEYKTELNE